ncbi:Glycine betaine transporter OpuD [bioreactor metagenome]|uniref:Glycine betaine transporter OpuD n=1 Tax=bioreactor metagenome TaxID=1076179 RepID=A0A645J5K8_9ZZZZ
MFIARISKGRTIRQFIIGVIGAPTLASIIWFSIFGTLGINLGIKGVISIDSLKSIALIPETAFFNIISYYPFSSMISIITMILLCTFFITSADSATFVLAMLTSKGNLNPSNKKKVLWGLVEALLAVGLLLSGGLQGLQAMAIVAAFPFIIIIILGFISLCKALIKEDIK